MAMTTERADSIMNAAVQKASELIPQNPIMAEIVCKQLLRCNPEHPDGLHLLGLAKHRLGKHVEAIEIIQTAIELYPENVDNYNNIALAYACIDEFDRAVTNLKKALELKPGNPLYLNNLALQYRNLDQHEQAVEVTRQALEVEEKPEIWTNLGGIYGEMRNLDEAEKCYQRAIEIDPDYAAAHVDQTHVYFLRGDWENGHREHEWRFKYFGQLGYYMDRYDQDKRWDGEADLNGKTFLVYSEQGMGDCIQFARYLPHLKSLGPKVIYHCPKPMKEIMERQDFVDEVLIRDIIHNQGDDWPEYDYQCSSMSLPLLLKDFVPDADPYLEPITRKFREQVEEEYPTELKIGIAWAGSPSHPKDQLRSIPLKLFKGIRDMEGVQIFNLQVDVRKRIHQNEQHLIDFTEGCKDWNLIDMTHMIQSFEDTATILSGLDLVISCDTSLVHMAGAMGTPCWMLLPYNPDWRWKLDGDTTEWYNTVRIFRQKSRHDWEGVFKEVEFAVKATVKGGWHPNDIERTTLGHPLAEKL